MSTFPTPADEFDMSLDIETLGREPGCNVLSIGATMFDPFGFKQAHTDADNHFYVVINSFDSMNKGFNSNTATLQWWKKQEIWDSLSTQVLNSDIGVMKACNLLADFVKTKKPRKIWANSPTFDIEILRAIFRKMQIDFPVHYRQEMDFRSTMELSYPNRDDRPARPAHLDQYLPHHALGDAILQSHQVIEAYQKLALLPQNMVAKMPADRKVDDVIAAMSEDTKNGLLRKLLTGDAVRINRLELDAILLEQQPRSKDLKKSTFR